MNQDYFYIRDYVNFLIYLKKNMNQKDINIRFEDLVEDSKIEEYVLGEILMGILEKKLEQEFKHLLLDIINLYKSFDDWLNNRIDHIAFFRALKEEYYLQRIEKILPSLTIELQNKGFEVINDRYIN